MNESLPMAAASPERGFRWWLFRQRGVLANLPLLFALFWTEGETWRTGLAWSLGLGLVTLGFAIRVWAQCHIGHHFEPPIKFTDTGPYAAVRNPLYVGNTLLIVGATCCSKLLWLAPISLLWCAIVYSLVVRHEERVLPEVYGDEYVRFLSNVPRWMPRWSALERSDFALPELGRAVRAELHCFLVVVPFLFKGLFLDTFWQPLWNRLSAPL